ncbi:hypothetical protein PHJA_000744600 [Phtheirospermum japonicum]|uniref:Uncharacterized protein n=1 Tax=Phtheirospermum japonicum TaxID=374723 RepID=A0A830BFN4_9LAMI|nr:hypothetical protein PHJA_000744600 [Phtheirospermum japonicum]
MGGKGQRRREKNYNAAHGGANTRLPPPPKPSSLDAVPSKLRKIMSLSGCSFPLSSPCFAGSVKQPFNRAKGKLGNDVNKGSLGEETDSMAIGMKRKRTDESSQNSDHRDEASEFGMSEKKKKKKKKNRADDLRFEAVGEPGAAVSHRKERRKQKKKSKRSKTDDDMDFPGREEIKFGDIVQAPPKLAVPKAFKLAKDASKERLRQQAVEAYRERKKWASRPGVQLPSPVVTSSY